MRYRPEVDGLRALAVVPVVLFHAGVTAFSGGYVGVDVFFVISGYLITSIILSDLEAGRFSLMRFYERRARRILPALCLVMLCCIPLAWAWIPPRQMMDFSESLVAAGLFASNILFWRETDYFASAAEEKPLLHTWSLAVEEQFYIFFPVMLLLLWRFGRRPTLCAVIALSAGSLMLSEWGWRFMPVANFYLLPTRLWELGAGALCAFALRDRPQRESSVLSLVGLGLILFAVFFFDKDTPFPSLYTLAPVGGAALLLLYAGPSTGAGRFLSVPPLVGIGLVSYSVYLWHQPLFAFARIRLAEPDASVMMLLAAATFVLAYLTWKYVETPFRQNLFRTMPSYKVAPLFGLALVPFILLGATGRATDGFAAQRLTDTQMQVLSTAAASPARARCHNQQPEHACTIFLDDYEWAVLGNSHGTELAFALADKLRHHEVGVKQYTVTACAPSFRRPKAIDRGDGCAEWENAAVEAITRDARIKTVVLSYRHENYQKEPEWRSYLGVIRAMVDAGKRTVVVLQAPLMHDHVHKYYRSFDHPTVSRVGRSRHSWNELYGPVRAALAEIPAGALVLDPADLFCDATDCFIVRDGVALYSDDNHMSINGAAVVADEILRRVPVEIPPGQGPERAAASRRAEVQ
jgi:peptidoglycan/LPS O-acetylase OafA/YrhL